MSGRVLHVLDRISLGGASRAAIALAAHAASYRHEALSLSPHAPSPTARRLAVDAGLLVRTGPDATEVAASVAAADIVLVHFWNNPEVYSFLGSELPACRLAVWAHVGGTHPPQVVTDELIRIADRLVTTSPHTHEIDAIRRAGAERVRLVRSGADLDRVARIRPQEHAGFAVGYIGTVDFVKMHRRYVEMSAAADIPGARFIVCGVGGATDVLRAEADALDRPERFELRGYVHDIGDILAELDVFGYPLARDNYSTSELVLQEAMAAGVPPVVLGHGGAALLVEHAVSGLVVENEEDSAGLERLYRDPTLRKQLAAGARKRARECFGAERTAREMEAVFAHLLREPRRLRPSSLRRDSAAEGFVASLGDGGAALLASLTGTDDSTKLAAEEQIAHLPAAMCSADAGGVLHYRRHYPDDPHLRLWAALVLEHQGRTVLALGELQKALQLGLDHWRVHWYLARAAARHGATELARRSLADCRRAAPGFRPARALAASLDSNS